jgi:peptidoglycan/LPS O-acetylase OafA/YrhL
VAGDTATIAAPTSRRSLTFDDFLASRSAGFDVVRLVLAFLVLVSHTWPLGGFGPEPLSPLTPKVLTLGGFSVGAFFALSGLLVGRSAINRPSGAFAKARVARIMPALWAAILVSAFVVALIGWVHRHHDVSGFLTFRPDGPFAYAGRAATLPVSFSHGIADVFVHDTPYGIATNGSFINGSLWTLPYEVRCYVVIGLVAVAARKFGTRRTITVAWCISLAIAIGYWKRIDLTSFVIGPYADRQLVAFLFVFLSGTLVAAWAHKITLFGWVPVAAFVFAVVIGRGPAFWSEHITQASMALVLPPVAALVAPVARVLRGVDLSYGLYLYAWPMQQIVALYHWSSRPATFIALSTLMAAACAAGSWFIVERPAMAWMRRR